MVKFYFLIFSALLMSMQHCGGQEASLPNVLIIHVDDLGYHDLGCTGSEIYDTPTIDKLAANSVSFTNAYTNYPRCVPSRYAFLSGMYPAKENKGKLGDIPESKSFIRQFNKEGYQTAYIGKYHLGEGDHSPTGIGFDYSFGAGSAGGTGSRFYPFNTRTDTKGDKAPIPDVEEYAREGDVLTDVLTDATIDWIKGRKKEEPFLAYLGFYAVHTPLEARKEGIARNKKEIEAYDWESEEEFISEGTGRRKMRQDVPEYADMVENVDENVEKLLSTLEDLKILDNTIVVLTSDHGGLSNDGTRKRTLATTNNPLRAGKGWLYEGGIRVPLMISWPGKLEPHIDNLSIIQGIDVMTTIKDLALGSPVSGIHGFSFKKVLYGKETWENRTVYFHSSKARPWSTGDSRMSAVRSGDYKLVHNLDTGGYELYNLKQDIGESKNLAADKQEKVEEMKLMLSKWKKEYRVKEYSRKENK